VEVLSAWRRIAAAGHLDERRAELAIADLRELRLERVPHEPLLARCWQLRSNLSMYDAVYVALAEVAGVGLLTADTKLAAAPGLRCEIELIT
jgi:predicted nucleic acid-binding protein